MQTDLLIKIKQVIEGRETQHELLGAVKAFCNNLGVENFHFSSSLFNTVSTTPDLRALSSQPEEWRNHYHQSDYFKSDIRVSHSRYKSTPLVWLDSTLKLDATNQKMFDEASDFGIVSGITFPYHGVGSEFGFMTGTVSEKFESSSLNSITIQHTLYLLGATLFDLHYQHKDNFVDKPLTIRERECLRWCAEGKTSWEMSVILRISERTACFHLDNAKKKLNSLTRTGAVSKALLHGLL